MTLLIRLRCRCWSSSPPAWWWRSEPFYPYNHPQRSCEGYVFTPVCLSTGGIYLSACWDTTTPRSRHPPGAGTPPEAGTPREQTPPRAGTPQEQTPPPPGSRHPPADGYCCGRYTSYWNTFLLSTAFTSIPAPIILFQLFYQRIWYYLYINKFNNIIVTETNEK